MRLCEFLLLIFTTVFICVDVFACKCFAARLCPVRAIALDAPEGVKCVCEDEFYGDKCQFRGKISHRILMLFLDKDNSLICILKIIMKVDQHFTLSRTLPSVGVVYYFLFSTKFTGYRCPMDGQERSPRGVGDRRAS